MFRVSGVFLLLTLFRLISYGQESQSAPMLKNGRLPVSNSLINHKITHPLWQSARFGERYFVIIQLERIAGPDQKAKLSLQGIQLGQFITGTNYLATCSRRGLLKNVREFGIKNIYAIPPALKINARLQNYDAQVKGPDDLIVITCFPVDKNQTEEVLKKSGAQIVDTKIKPANTWFVHASASVIEKIAQLPIVSSINPIHLRSYPLNNNNRATHGVHALAATVGRNLTGRGLIVGIGDNANPSGHIDLAGKLIMRTDEPIDDHGTHTSGTLAGGGIFNPLYAGMAPGSHLVVNQFNNIIVNSPAYVADYKMPLTNNSYSTGAVGCPGDGDYDVLSYYIDSQLLALPKLLHVFAAGNDAFITCSPFPPGYGTIKSGFQTAKNVLTVGSMNDYNYTIGGGSSRGPANDGRIKPELVAGGVGITSTLPGNLYNSATGTSMASPTVTGILTLITERYRQLHGGDNPEGALLKAMVTNCAVDLGNPGPDFTFGFGMINGRTTVETLEQNHYFTGNIGNNGNQLFTIPALPSGNYQLKIMLYWPDAPTQSLSSKNLVNDLDLTVTEPGGSVHKPMILDPSPPNLFNNATEGDDHLNNIEQVLINNPAAGDYTLTVNGFSVPAGPQKFYLVYEILLPSVTVEFPFGSETMVPGESVYLKWTAYGGEPNSFTLEYSPDGGSSWTLINNAVPSSDRGYLWTVPSGFTSNALIRVSRNNTGYVDTSDYPFTILGQPDLTVTNTCPGYVQMKWNSISGADSYDILKFSGDSMGVIGHTTDSSWLATALNKDSIYWFSVRAVRAGIWGRRSGGRQILPNGGACTAPTLDNDLSVDSLLVPTSGRQFTASQTGIQRITMMVRNPGNLPTSLPVSYSYQVGVGAVVTESDATPIPAHANRVFSFSPANSFDFSAVGKYDIKTWVSYAADTIHQNDTILTTIKSLRNDPLILSPSFTEGFETAADKTYNRTVVGLDSLDRADFSNSGSNGRLNSFFNSGFARSGKRSMMLDVTAQGTNAADSLTNTFNLSNYTSFDQIWLDIYFKKQSPAPALPGNQIWIRGNDQAAWIPVKSLSDPLDLPGKYIKLNLDLTGILAAASPAQTISSSFQIRCGSEGMTPAAASDPIGVTGGGISFDDIMITRSQNDIGMKALVLPNLKNICALGSAEKITVSVRNYGTAAELNIPVSYAINNDTVTEIIPSLAPQDSLQYTFTKTADMSDYQEYHIKTWVSNPADNYRNNDSSSDYVVQTSPVINQYPYLESFENNNGNWYTSGQNDSWQWGHPAKTVIHKAANGSNAWVTNLTGNYNDNENSYLYSPCFDLTGLIKPVISFSHIFWTEDNCHCDFHWLEYSLDDSVWKVLADTGLNSTNWYDDITTKAWQLTDSSWHVSSIEIPVITNKIRFRFVMSSDPGVNYEGIGIDDIHIFEKAPVFTDSLVISITQPVSGSNWIDFDKNGQRIFSINPGGQDLGNTRLTVFNDTAVIRDTAGQDYGSRNWVVQTSKPPVSDVAVRYYFTDGEAKKLIQATGCDSCLSLEDAYSTGITQYSSENIPEEDSSLKNNRTGSYQFHKPQQDVRVIPYDNGYYAETLVQGFSEFWLNGGGKKQNLPLAAWLIDFTATRSNASGLLDWSTQQTAGFLKYIVEKSPDNTRFTRIGELAAIPNTDSVQSYHYTDPELWSGPNYYRLVVYYLNGDSLVSPVRTILYNKDSTDVKVYPNPTQGNIAIYTASSCREIQIFDVLGRKLLEKPCQGFVQQVSMASFTRGVYFLKLFTDSGNKLIKLEKR